MRMRSLRNVWTHTHKLYSLWCTAGFTLLEMTRPSLWLRRARVGAMAVRAPKYPAGRTGFTLLEMIISLGIFAVITGFVVANYRGGRLGDELNVAQQLTAVAVRRAQTAAVSGTSVPWCVGGTNDKHVCLSGQDSECPNGGACVGDIPRGYGVRFSTVGNDAGFAIGFADIDGNGILGTGEETRRDKLAPSPSVAVTAVTPASGGVLDVVFSPPRPTITFNDTAADVIASITVTHSLIGKSRTVTANKVSGQVNVE